MRPQGPYPGRPLCPWDSSGKNTGVGCHLLLQGIFPTWEDTKPKYLMFPALAGRFLTARATREILAESVSSSLSHVLLFAAPWTAACQASLSITISQSLLKLMSIESVMPSNHLILCRPLLLLPSIFPIIRVFLMSQLFASAGHFSHSPSSKELAYQGGSSRCLPNSRLFFFSTWAQKFAFGKGLFIGRL